MSGKMTKTLPFLLPSEGDSQPQLDNIEGRQCEVSSETVESMRQVYMVVAPELQSLVTLYNKERETARNRRRPKTFPKFDQWIPEASDLQTRKETIVVQPTVVSYNQYLLESKQHSRNNLYVCQEHPTKRPSIVYFSPPSEDRIQNVKFGVIQTIYSHSFCQRMYIWATVSLYKEPHFDSSSGLWWSHNSFCHAIPVLLSSLSNPLTVAYDKHSNVWFLDVYL